MTTPQTLKPSPQSIRAQIEQALHTFPWSNARMAELRLRIEEAIEVSYEIELKRDKGRERASVLCLPSADRAAGLAADSPRPSVELVGRRFAGNR